MPCSTAFISDGSNGCATMSVARVRQRRHLVERHHGAVGFDVHRIQQRTVARPLRSPTFLADVLDRASIRFLTSAFRP
jgi:hypothetical protein